MKAITDLKQIDRTTKEGRLLFAALAKITTESQTNKTPYQVLEQLEKLASKMDEHTCKYCGALTSQDDEKCYKNPEQHTVVGC